MLFHAGRFLCALVLGLGLSGVPAPAAAQSQYDPLVISQPQTLALAADPRFEAPDRGTVEMWLAVRPSKTTKPVRALCIAEHGTTENLRWRLSYDPISQQLLFGIPGKVITIPWAKEGYHHLAIVTAGGWTGAIVDGVSIEARSAIQPLNLWRATPEGLPLTFGCTDGPTARAHISTFRLWSVALTPDDIAFTRNFPGHVTGQPDLHAGLLAYALFTDAAKEIRFKGAQIAFTPMQGAAGGEPFFYRRPPDQELGSIYTVGRAGFILSDFAVEFDRASRGWTMLDGPALADFSLPTILPRRVANQDGQVAAELERDLAALARQTAPNAREVATTINGFRKSRLAERRVAFGWRDSVLQGVNTYQEGGISAFSMPLQTGVRLQRIIGSYGTAGIKALRFDLSGGDRSEFRGFGENRQSTFSLDLPPGARLEGIAGRKLADGTLMALSLAYSAVPDDARTLGDRLSDGVWVERDDSHPLRDPGGDQAGTEQAAFNGTYADRPVYRVTSTYGGNLLILSVEKAKGETVTHGFQLRAGNEWEGLQSRAGEFDTDGDRLFIEDDHLRWTHSKDTEGRGIILVRPKAYPTADDSKLPWGATFSLEHRPNGVIANFMGYNPARMRARDYQSTTGARQQVFQMPDDGSSDYTATDSRLIVPHGLFFSLDSKGSETADANELSTATERQKSSTLGLGLNIGIPLVASFSVDGSHQESQKTAYKSDYSIVLNQAIITHYALVADLARIKLHPDFRARILDLRDRQATGFPIDWDAFIDDFGTHFPYAVTYGGVAWSETTKDANSNEIENSIDDKLETKASGFLDDVLEVGVSANSEQSEGSKQSSGSVREHSTYGTYGGSMSKGGGWAVNRGEELPVLLDLRHITYLLSPVFFDDISITRDLRAAMETALASHFDDLEAAMLAEMQNWDPGRVPGPRPEGEGCEFLDCEDWNTP